MKVGIFDVVTISPLQLTSELELSNRTFCDSDRNHLRKVVTLYYTMFVPRVHCRVDRARKTCSSIRSLWSKCIIITSHNGTLLTLRRLLT